MPNNKVIIFSAPSGAGKTTIVKHLLNNNKELFFSISATSRKKREGETNGKDYYFLTADEFKNKINNGEFLEYEEVYKDNFYGTLKSEVERIWGLNKNVLFDVDVKGGINIKKYYKEKALLIFVMPPSLEELERRLRSRSTEAENSIIERIAKAETEISYKDKFDIVLINDNLNDTLVKASDIVNNFILK